MTADPLYKKFDKRAKGALQHRAISLREQLDDTDGAPLVESVYKTISHAGQLVLETLDQKVPLVRSYDAAVPILGRSTVESRKKNAAITPVLDPQCVGTVEKINRT